MKTTVLALSLFFVALCSHAQIRAITSNGDEVLLYDDGTWKYVGGTIGEASGAPETNPTIFTKGKTATFQVKSARIPMSVWIDPKKWSFKKADPDEPSEYEFTLKGEEAHAILITEKIEIPLSSLRDIALENAREVAPDVYIAKEEYRTVNDTKVLCVQMNGTVQGIKFSYFGYYFSNASGTIQFITYTSQKLLADYQKAIEQLLNGMVITD